MKKKVIHPNFYVGLLSFLLLFMGIGFRANSYSWGDYVLIGSFVVGGIHWIWSIIDVLKDYKTGGSENRKIIWVIFVVLIPPIGGMLYYLLGSRVKM
ncbi:MAG TPA: PLD nuclease N-terminal domain-containing protein [Flavisolibacter sp.]|nr:PLD nuclease N-terminal domain-containing protein [Flavisolibacter sp.]